MPTRSAAFERFRFSFFEDPDSAHQGLDTPALAGLAAKSASERKRCSSRSSPTAAPSSASACWARPRRSRIWRRSSKPSAWRNGPRSFSPTRAGCLTDCCIWRRPSGGFGRIRAGLLPQSTCSARRAEPIERQEAAEALYDVRDPAAVQALVEALDDPEPLVRYHAARGLLAISGLSAESKDPQHMLYRLMADEASRREGGKRDILAAVAAAPLKSAPSASEPADRGGAGT